jgi:hypothetical protein
LNELISYRVTPESFAALRSVLLKQPETVSFKDEPRLAALIASLGLQREFGTINDEMARFVYDADTGEPIPYDRIQSELVHYNGSVGVRVWVPGHDRLELRFKGIQSLLHPRFSYREDGSLYQCVFFPESIARILERQDTDLVVVREWGMNTIFGGFDPGQHYYQTNFWELENNDTLRFARLLEQRRVPFLGTHDLVAHIAGVKASAWPSLASQATEVRETLEDDFGAIQIPTIASLVIPYTVGVLLDDLAQPPNYDAPGRRIMIDEGLRVIRSRRIDPTQPRVLMRFPKGYERAIRLARDTDLNRVRNEAKQTMDALVTEIQTLSVEWTVSTSTV